MTKPTASVSESRLHTRAAATAVLALSLMAACNWTYSGDPTGGYECCSMGGGAGPYPLPPLDLSPIYNLVSGETQVVSAYTTIGDGQVTWEITGAAVFAVGSDSTRRIDTPTRGVHVRGSGSGLASIKVIASNGDFHIRDFQVAQAEDLTLRIINGKSLSLRVGQTGYIAAHLLDAQGRYYLGEVTWTLSDSTRISLRQDPNIVFGRNATGVAAGALDVILAFRTLRDTSHVEVTP